MNRSFGQPGKSVLDLMQWPADVRARASLFEKEVGGVVDDWLKRRRPGADVFHDLEFTGTITGIPGQKPFNCGDGAGNLDHLVVGKMACLFIDAKATSPGLLHVDDQGNGALRLTSGISVKEQWLDYYNFRFHWGLIAAVTQNLPIIGFVWVVPDHTKTDQSLDECRLFRLSLKKGVPGSWICNAFELSDFLDERISLLGPPSPQVVLSLRPHLTVNSVVVL